MNYSRQIGPNSAGGNRYTTGLAYVIIPSDVDRDSYVRECLKTGFVSIIGEENNMIPRARCDKQVLQTIDFPAKTGVLGSQVAYIVIPKYKVPFVVANVNKLNEYNDIKENQFKINRKTDFGFVDITGDGNGNLSISVSSNQAKKGKININLNNNNGDSQFNLNVRGTTTINASDKITVKSDKEVNVISPLIKHNDGTEPMVLGQTLADILKEFIRQTSTSTNAGGPLSNASQIAALEEQVDDILSKISNLD